MTSPLDLADESAIRTLTQHLAEAWNRHDSSAYAALFTNDCDYVAFDGTRLRSRGENESHHRALFETVLKGSRLVFESDVEVAGISENVALMHAKGTVLLPWQDQVHTRRRSIQSYIAVRASNEKWLIRAFHNSRIRPQTIPTGLGLVALLAIFEMRTRLVGRRRQPSPM